MCSTVVSRSWRLRVTLAAAAISATAAVGVAGAAAAANPPSVPSGQQPSLPPQSQAAHPAQPESLDAAPLPTTDAATWRALDAKAAKHGQVAVIVTLNVKAKAEGRLGGAQRTAQRNRIADSRQGVIGDLRGHKLRAIKRFDAVPVLALHVDRAGLAALKRSPNVAGVSEDRLVAAPAADTPQGTSSNSNLADWWNIYRTSTDTAWTNGYDGRGQTVAVLDTGVQRDHPWLSGKVVSEACFSTAPSGVGGYCPNGASTQYGTGAAAPCVTFCNAHGTHVASTAAGSNGVARGAGIIGVQVFHPDGSSALSYTSDQLKGLERVYNLRGSYSIAAVNLSIGSKTAYTGTCDNLNAENYSFYSWVYWLKSVGIATVVATGNEGISNGVASPSCITNVVRVGNSTLDLLGNDAVYSGSNSSSLVSLLAPGTDICNAVPFNRVECGWTGTSMAAPHVTGAFAALKQLRPWTTVSSSLTALQASGQPVTDSRNGVTRSRINTWNALVYLYNH
jgi:subtilisin